MPRAIVVALLALLLTSCASASIPRLGDFGRLKLDKLFVVVVEPKDVADPSKGCKVVVYPDSGENVRIKPSWNVAWALVNRCDATEHPLSLAFTYVGLAGAGGGTAGAAAAPGQIKEPIAFASFANRLLLGRVKSRRFWFFAHKCQSADEDAPCGRYTYTLKVGNLTLDPDIEIVDHNP
jgi:hypothetical protein